jgi:hypothetical protein
LARSACLLSEASRSVVEGLNDLRLGVHNKRPIGEDRLADRFARPQHRGCAGGILTFGYSVVRGFGADDNTFRFIIVSVGLVIALGLGYIRFARPDGQATTSTESP